MLFFYCVFCSGCWFLPARAIIYKVKCASLSHSFCGVCVCVSTTTTTLLCVRVEPGFLIAHGQVHLLYTICCCWGCKICFIAISPPSACGYTLSFRLPLSLSHTRDTCAIDCVRVTRYLYSDELWCPARRERARARRTIYPRALYNSPSSSSSASYSLYTSLYSVHSTLFYWSYTWTCQRQTEIVPRNARFVSTAALNYIYIYTTYIYILSAMVNR